VVDLHLEGLDVIEESIHTMGPLQNSMRSEEVLMGIVADSEISPKENEGLSLVFSSF
jgi:hypothetical protein